MLFKCEFTHNIFETFDFIIFGSYSFDLENRPVFKMLEKVNKVKIPQFLFFICYSFNHMKHIQNNFICVLKKKYFMTLLNKSPYTSGLLRKFTLKWVALRVILQIRITVETLNKLLDNLRSGIWIFIEQNTHSCTIPLVLEQNILGYMNSMVY